MKEILVSTITPCYKMKRYLKKFLEEFPNQTMFNQIEIVLDHNEPDDEEIKWVQEFQEKYPGRIKHIIVPKVEPIGVSMNRCIRESNGDFLTIWNIDDLRTPDSIELQYRKLSENNEFGVVFGDHMIVDSFGKTKGEYIDRSKYKKEELLSAMLLGPFFMFKKQLVESVGYFDEQFKVCADFDFALRLLLNTRAVHIKQLIGYYLDEGKGASTRTDLPPSPETTVIQLRYGIYDKLNYDLVAEATQYMIKHCILDSRPICVGEYVKNYSELINKNKKLIKRGLYLYIIKKVFLINKLEKNKRYLKKYIPNVLLELYQKYA